MVMASMPSMVCVHSQSALQFGSEIKSRLVSYRFAGLAGKGLFSFPAARLG
jgi:hypothetical protein